MIPPHDLDEPTETEARLLRAARSYRASDKIRRSTLEAVSGTLATNAGAPPKGLDAPFRQMLSSPKLALGVLALAVGFAAVVPLLTRETSEAREASKANESSGRHPLEVPAPVVSAPVVSAPVPAVPTVSMADIPLVQPKPVRTAVPAAQPSAAVEPASASTDSLTLEIAALDRARRALKRKEPIAALQALDAHRQRFPSGALRPEATALRVEALLARGDDAEARALAEAFLADHATSPLAPRVRSLSGVTKD